MTDVSTSGLPSTIRLIDVRRVCVEEPASNDRSTLDSQAECNRKTAERVGATLIAPPLVIIGTPRDGAWEMPEWQTLRSLMAEPDVHISVDRIARIIGPAATWPLLIDCMRTNTRIYHSEGVVDLATYEGQITAMLGTLTLPHHHLIRERALAGREARQRAGICVTPAHSLPLGIQYLRTRKGGQWTYNDEIKIVSEIYRLVVNEGLWNWSEVARRSGAASGSQVRSILTNPIYTGWWIIDTKPANASSLRADGRRQKAMSVRRRPDEVYRHQVFRPKGTPHEDERDEAIVDEATWNDIQEIVSQKSRHLRANGCQHSLTNGRRLRAAEGRQR